MNCIIVGAGFGAQHAAWLSRIPGVRLGALAYDVNADRAHSLQAQFGIDVVGSDAERMIASGQYELVTIVSPPHTHLPLVRSAVEAGAAVVVDKPLAESLASAQEIVRIGAEARKPAFVFFQWRLHPAFAALRDRIASGALGPLTHVAADFRHDFLAANRTAWSWRHAESTAGAGALSDLGVHVLDLLRFVSGSDWRVRDARIGLAHPQRSVGDATVACSADDFADLHLGRPGDACTAHVSVSRVAIGSRELAVRAFGRNGAAAVLVDVEAGRGRTVLLSPEGERSEETFDLAGFNPYEALVAAAKGGAPAAPHTPASLEDGLAAQSLMTDALQLASGRTSG